MGQSPAQNVAQKLISTHLVTTSPASSDLAKGELEAGTEIALSIDQTLTQDATGTMVMLELEALGLTRVETSLSAQYVDHNLLQTDEKNSDDHLFLLSAAQRFGLWFSKPGNGVSHPVHQARFGIPGTTMIGSDSHTCAAGALGMLAIGVGGLEVAMAMAGEPLYISMPQIWGVELTGELPPWVSAKDVILELLRRHDVKGGVGRIIEYHGAGLAGLTAMDRHVIANMGAELGATTSVFPADGAVRAYLESVGRPEDYTELLADDGASYDVSESIALDQLVPLIAKPSSPGNVVPVSEVAGEPVSQVVLGSSANPGLRDFAVVAEILRDQQISPAVSLDVNPTSRELLADLTKGGWLVDLIKSGARIHQSGCMGCIGMGQAPATGRNSLRTMPRNFPGRSGNPEDSVWLCSPETAAAAALTGVITDPRELDMTYPRPQLPRQSTINTAMLLPPLPPEEASRVELVKAPNIASLPEFDALPNDIDLPVLLKVGDNISTDEILPAGARVLPYRSNIPRISEFVYTQVDPSYAGRARDTEGGHAVVGGANYGQGSSREHAVIAPRYLGLRVLVAKSFARIHWQNLANFGVLALEFSEPEDYDRLRADDVLGFRGLRTALAGGGEISATIGRARSERATPTGSSSRNSSADTTGDQGDITFRHRLSARQLAMVLAGGRIPYRAEQLKNGQRT